MDVETAADKLKDKRQNECLTSQSWSHESEARPVGAKMAIGGVKDGKGKKQLTQQIWFLAWGMKLGLRVCT